MRLRNSRAAARWFDRVRNPDDHYPEAIEPEDPGPIHAYLFDPDHPRYGQGWILGQPGTALLEDGAEEAACGMGIRVIYPMSFDTDDPDACERCVEMATLRETNPREFQRRVEERHERWRDRKTRATEAHMIQDALREQSYGNDPIDDEDEQL